MKNLIVPFEHKDFAKSFGCKWNLDEKVWQIEESKYVQWHKAYALYREQRLENLSQDEPTQTEKSFKLKVFKYDHNIDIQPLKLFFDTKAKNIDVHVTINEKGNVYRVEINDLSALHVTLVIYCCKGGYRYFGEYSNTSRKYIVPDDLKPTLKLIYDKCCELCNIRPPTKTKTTTNLFL